MSPRESDLQACHIVLFQMYSFQKSWDRQRKQDNLTHAQEESQPIEVVPEEPQVMNLSDKNFKSATLSGME